MEWREPHCVSLSVSQACGVLVHGVVVSFQETAGTAQDATRHSMTILCLWLKGEDGCTWGKPYKDAFLREGFRELGFAYCEWSINSKLFNSQVDFSSTKLGTMMFFEMVCEAQI